MAIKSSSSAVQMTTACRQKMVRDGGINEVLIAIEPYRREKQPLKDKAEEEYVFELCNVLSSCLMDTPSKARFVEDQGVELMMLVLKGRQIYRVGVMKVLL
jgi:beta-catenin-like protein 1